MLVSLRRMLEVGPLPLGWRGRAVMQLESGSVWGRGATCPRSGSAVWLECRNGGNGSGWELVRRSIRQLHEVPMTLLTPVHRTLGLLSLVGPMVFC